MTENSKTIRIIERKTYTRSIYSDETMREGRIKEVKTSPIMVEIRPHEYVNLTAALEHGLINPNDKLLLPE
jgi:hypothetical protein